jgi:hypothetical protein
VERTTIAGETEVLGENLLQSHLVPPQIPHEQVRFRTLDRSSGKPATNRLSYGAAKIYVTYALKMKIISYFCLISKYSHIFNYSKMHIVTDFREFFRYSEMGLHIIDRNLSCVLHVYVSIISHRKRNFLTLMQSFIRDMFTAVHNQFHLLYLSLH